MRIALSTLLVGLASGSFAVAAPAAAPQKGASAIVRHALSAAAGTRDTGAQVRLLTSAARSLLKLPDTALGVMHRSDLRTTLARKTAGPRRARELRAAMGRLQGDTRFRPRMEASMPPGFPKPGPVGKIVVKAYPAYRAAETKGGGSSFWKLFMHIKRNRVEMTAPVEMTMDDNMRERSMAFLYEHSKQGRTGRRGRIAVKDLSPKTWLSIGMRGSRSSTRMRQAQRWLLAHAKQHGYARAGAYRVMGYNSPRVRGSRRFYEIQMPVTKTTASTPTRGDN